MKINIPTYLIVEFLQDYITSGSASGEQSPVWGERRGRLTRLRTLPEEDAPCVPDASAPASPATSTLLWPITKRECPVTNTSSNTSIPQKLALITHNDNSHSDTNTSNDKSATNGPFLLTNGVDGVSSNSSNSSSNAKHYEY